MTKIVFSDSEVKMIGASRWAETHKFAYPAVYGSTGLVMFGVFKFLPMQTTGMAWLAVALLLAWFIGIYQFLIGVPQRKAGKVFLKEYRE